jgi:Zn finger protein HypA/HybF involved in hydrogenase expression
MKEATKRWITAGTLLASDPDAKVRCPECEREDLVVMDVPIEGSNELDRYMSCPNCRSWNVMLMSKKEPRTPA